MKIFDFVEKTIHRNQIKQFQNPTYEETWRELLHCDINEETDKIIEKELTEEQVRSEQIKYISCIILNLEDLKKEDIIKFVKNKYDNVLLSDVDVEAIITIYNTIEHEDMYGDCNIREFIDEEENNIVELVDKLISKAKEEAKKYRKEEIKEFVSTDYKTIIGIKEQIEKNNSEMEID